MEEYGGGDKMKSKKKVGSVMVSAIGRNLEATTDVQN